jgi:hypothetical protein
MVFGGRGRIARSAALSPKPVENVGKRGLTTLVISLRRLRPCSRPTRGPVALGWDERESTEQESATSPAGQSIWTYQTGQEPLTLSHGCRQSTWKTCLRRLQHVLLHRASVTRMQAYAQGIRMTSSPISKSSLQTGQSLNWLCSADREL